jgi:hypothetical protein
MVAFLLPSEDWRQPGHWWHFFFLQRIGDSLVILVSPPFLCDLWKDGEKNIATLGNLHIFI